MAGCSLFIHGKVAPQLVSYENRLPPHKFLGCRDRVSHLGGRFHARSLPVSEAPGPIRSRPFYGP